MCSLPVIFRQPSAEILRWDDLACESACTAQLLYMYGKLELPLDTDKFDARIGRSPDEYDQQSGNLRVLFEQGFHITQISSVDMERLVCDMSYVRDRWIKAGDSPEEVDAYLPKAYPGIRARILNKLAVLARYPEQYQRIARDSTWRDVEEMLENGYHVGCDVWKPEGLSHRLLIVRSLGTDIYEVFVPDRGVRRMKGSKKLAPNLLPGIEAYRLPL